MVEVPGVVVGEVEPRGAVVVVELTGALVDVVVVEIGRVVVVDVVVDVVVVSAPPGREVVVVVAGCVVGVVATGMKVPEMLPLVAGNAVVGPLGGYR